MSAKESEKPLKHLGIPEAEFVDDVEKYVADMGETSCDKPIQKLEELHQKYKMMETSLSIKKTKLKIQIPEIKTTLGIVNHLTSIKDKDETMDTQFMLSGSLRIKASVPPTKEVGLWLGANVMLTYSLEDAHDLLTENLGLATKSLEEVNDDLDFLRDQLTTTEVSMARLFNWDVMKKRREKGLPT